MIKTYNIISALGHLVILIYLIGVEIIYWGFFKGISPFLFVDDYITGILIIYFSVTGIVFSLRKKRHVTIFVNTKNKVDTILDNEFSQSKKYIVKPLFLSVNNLIYAIISNLYILILILFDTTWLLEVDKNKIYIFYPLFLGWSAFQLFYSIYIIKMKNVA